MLWSVSYPDGVSLANLVQDLDNGVFVGPADDESTAQTEVAKAAAFALIASGVVGEAKVYNVYLSGNATPQFEPADGLSHPRSHPSVSISVSMQEPYTDERQTELVAVDGS